MDKEIQKLIQPHQITLPQWHTIWALLECDGWSGSQNIERHGGNCASIGPLLRIGAVFERESECAKTGFPYREWRLSLDWFQHSSPSMPEQFKPGLVNL